MTPKALVVPGCGSINVMIVANISVTIVEPPQVMAYDVHIVILIIPKRIMNVIVVRDDEFFYIKLLPFKPF